VKNGEGLPLSDPGGEGRILRFVFLHSIVLAVLVGLLTLAQAYLLPWMIPAAW
jgi:L-lactate permease